MKIYHGSTQIIEKPLLELGKKTNDFGQGFYCTEDKEKAKEWACKSNENGQVNSYELNLDKLKVLDLTDDKYDALHWITLLLKYRTFEISHPVSTQTKEYLFENYLIDVSKYDVIKGYRADDSYFSYAKAFLSNTITVEDLEKSLHFGNLGTQIVIVSKRGMDSLKFIKAEDVDKKEYYSKYVEIDKKARENYLKLLNDYHDGVYAIDIVRGNKNGKKSV